MHWPSTPSLVAFVVIVIAVLVALVVGLVHAARPEARVRTGVLATGGALLWLTLTGLPTGLGVYDIPEPFPRLAPYVLTCFAMAFAVGFSPVGRRLAERVPVAWLVAFHAFRLPLELVLHDWAVEGTIPADLSYLGQNFDVVVAVLALLVAPFGSVCVTGAFAGHFVLIVWLWRRWTGRAVR